MIGFVFRVGITIAIVYVVAKHYPTIREKVFDSLDFLRKGI